MKTEAVTFDAWMVAQLARVEDALAQAVPEFTAARLGETMRYGVLDGGKRLRPLLVIAACEAADGQAERAFRCAVAVELIHAYSLIHDDLPCMDNDVLRRGKPTVHVQYGEAQALLAGDAMQALAFDVLTGDDSVPAVMQSRWCRSLARASGHAGMAGGQAIDLASVNRQLSEDELRTMHRLKTGALLHASVMMGAACGDLSLAAEAALSDFGWALGLAFQVVDDILDVTQDTAELGKSAGKDAAQNKPTYVSLMGLERAKAYALDLHGQALQALRQSGLHDLDRLIHLADMVVHRTH